MRWKKVVNTPSLVVFKVRLDGTFSNLMQSNRSLPTAEKLEIDHILMFLPAQIILWCNAVMPRFLGQIGISNIYTYIWQIDTCTSVLAWPWRTFIDIDFTVVTKKTRRAIANISRLVILAHTSIQAWLRGTKITKFFTKWT